MVTVSSGVPQPAESAEGRIVGEEDWQRCRRILEARKAEEQSPPMQEHIADLSDVLQKLNKQQRPNKIELREMAKSLGLPKEHRCPNASAKHTTSFSTKSRFIA